MILHQQASVTRPMRRAVASTASEPATQRGFSCSKIATAALHGFGSTCRRS